MEPIILCLWLAGLLHLLIGSANFVAARMLDYRGNLRHVSPIVRDVFWVQNAYIELILAAFAGICFCFPEELAGHASLGHCVSAFLAIFWGLRLLIQVCFYNAAIRRQHRWIDNLFVTAQVYLTGVFIIAFWGGAK